MENNFCQKFLENSLLIFSIIWNCLKIDGNTLEKFSDEISAKFNMTRLMKILLVDSLIFIIASKKEMLIVFRQFEINSHY